MTFSNQEIAEFAELINNALDNIPVKNKKNFLPIWEGLQNILNPGSGKTAQDETIQEHLSNIADTLNEPTLGYTELDNFPQFQNIIRDRITSKIQEFQSMTRSQQARYMRKQRQKAGKARHTNIKMEQIKNNPRWIETQQEHNTGAEETEQEALIRIQEAFQREGIPPDIYLNHTWELETLVDAGISLHQLSTMNQEILTELIGAANNVEILILHANISFQELITIDSDLRVQLLKNAYEIQALTTVGISLNQLKTMPPDILNQFISNTDEIQALISYEDIGIEQLITMDSITLTELIYSETEKIYLKYINQFEKEGNAFLQKEGISLDILHSNIQLIKQLENPELINRMHTHFFNLLAEMPQDMRVQYIKNATIVINNIKWRDISFEKATAIKIVLNSTNLIAILLNNINFSIEELIAMQHAIRTQIITNAHIVETLINDGDIEIQDCITLEDSTTLTELINTKKQEIHTRNIDEFENAGSIFLEQEGISLDIFNKDNPEIKFNTILNNRDLINRLHTHFFNLLAAMSPEIRIQFINNANAIASTYNLTSYSFKKKSLIGIATDSTILIGRLINYVNLSVEELSIMNPAIRAQFIETVHIIEILIKDDETFLEALLKIEDPERYNDFIKTKMHERHERNINQLEAAGNAFLQAEGISLTMVNNPEALFKIVYSNPKIINRMHTHFLTLLASMTPEIRDQFIYDANIIIREPSEKNYAIQQIAPIDIATKTTILIGALINNMQISVKQLITMTPEIRDQFIRYAYHFTALINNGHISVEQFLAMTPEIRDQFIKHASHFATLINNGHISIEQFLAMIPENYSEFIQNAKQKSRPEAEFKREAEPKLESKSEPESDSEAEEAEEEVPAPRRPRP